MKSRYFIERQEAMGDEGLGRGPQIMKAWKL